MTGLPFVLQILVWKHHIRGAWEFTASVSETRGKFGFRLHRNGAPAWDDDLGIAGYTGYAEREMSAGSR